MGQGSGKGSAMSGRTNTNSANRSSSTIPNEISQSSLSVHCSGSVTLEMNRTTRANTPAMVRHP